MSTTFGTSDAIAVVSCYSGLGLWGNGAMAVEKPLFVTRFKISPRPTKDKTEFLLIHLDVRSEPPLEFAMEPHVAMVLMRSLQDFQRRYRWKVPVVTVVKPSKKS